MHASFFISTFKPTTSIHHTSMDIEIENLYHASKYMKCTFKCNKQVYELAPPTCVIKILILIDPFLYHISPLMSNTPQSLISLFLSPFVNN